MLELISPSHSSFLYLHKSSVDLYLNSIRKALNSLPGGIIKVEDGCLPIITDYSPYDSKADKSEITLGYGYHFSDFEENPHPISGLVFCLNPPHASGIQEIVMHHTKHGDGVIPINSSFLHGEHKFILTSQEFNLDETPCGEVATKERYAKK